jgi:hypothetical protein
MTQDEESDRTQGGNIQYATTVWQRNQGKVTCTRIKIRLAKDAAEVAH